MQKTLEEMTAEMHAAMFDPRRKLATSEEVGQIRDDVMLVDSASKARTEFSGTTVQFQMTPPSVAAGAETCSAVARVAQVE